MAKKALELFTAELDRATAAFKAERAAGGEIRASTRADLNLTRKLLDNVEGLIEEKGW